MKKYLLTFALLALVVCAYAQSAPFVLQGKISGAEVKVLRLYYQGPGDKTIIDSAFVTNGSFEFKGSLNGPTMCYITSSRQPSMGDPNFTSFFMEPGNVTIELTTGNFKALKVKGSKTHDELASLELKKREQRDQINVLSVAYDKENELYRNALKAGKPEAELEAIKEKANSIKDKMAPFRAQMSKIDMEYIRTHPDSYYSAYALRGMLSSLTLEESKSIFGGLTDKVKQSGTGKQIAAELKSLEGGSPGAKANLFSATDINGEKLDLADYKGKKYLLLDFWASWCVPCRKGNPHLLSLYNKYKDKGLEIVGVSDDDGNVAAWKKAVAQDKIGVWKHVLRGLKRVGNGFDKSADLSGAYAIHTLPTKVLIDKNGTIIGRYGGGGEDDAALDKKLAEIFE